MKKLRNKNEKGFTLIELLVVIAIIGLLASVVLLALNSARAKSRDAKRLADMRQIASAMELYFNDVNYYPTSSGNNANTAFAGDTAVTESLKAKLTPKYIGLLPASPTPQDGSCTATGVNSNEYYWLGAGVLNGGSYTVTFCLGGLTGGYAAGQHTLTPAGIQ